VPATVAHHIEPHRGDYTVFKLSPLRSLCKACHDSLDHHGNRPRYPTNADGSPSDPRHPWNAR
jgi:hypothetical protein